MDPEIDKDKDIFKAIDTLEKKDTKASKTEKGPEIKIKNIESYKQNELSVNINNFLAKNIDPKAGECLFGENLARTGEYYGLKATPVIGLIIASIGVIVVFANKIFRLKKEQKKDEVF